MTANKCRVSTCDKSAMVPWSNYCRLHGHRKLDYGHPTRRAVPRHIRPEYRARVLVTMERAAGSTGMRDGLKIAERLLNYRAPGTAMLHLRIERHMEALRAGGVEPWHLLQCVAECAAAWRYTADVYFPTEEMLMKWLARQVIQLVPHGGSGRPHGTTLATLGKLLREELFTFGLGLVVQMERDEAAKVERSKSWASPEAWAPPPPLKRKYRASAPDSRRRKRPRNPVTGTFLPLAEEARLRAEGKQPAP